ncbi:hypothetical protein [Streptomyces sp. NPDC048659]|uniref:hypothetical protein n=1 Tax=Streptomyces sp. NPDC048659 TaxID=3155489 RepID=UPI003436F7B2
MWWPWGRDREEREYARASAEEALRYMTATFYEAEVLDRAITSYAAELRRLMDDGFGLRRASVAPVLDACAQVEAVFVTVFTEYFELRDALLPLRPHASVRGLRKARAAFEEASLHVLGPMDDGAAAKQDLDKLFDTIASFRTLCRPPALAAADGLAAAEAELAALAADGVTSGPLRRRLRDTARELEVLKDGRGELVHMRDVAAAFHRLHAEAEDLRRRIRIARPLAAVLDRETAAVVAG